MLAAVLAGTAVFHGVAAPGKMVACLLAALGLFVPRVRGKVAVALVMAATYAASSRHHAGTLGQELVVFAGIWSLALFICWPQLIEAPPDD